MHKKFTYNSASYFTGLDKNLSKDLNFYLPEIAEIKKNDFQADIYLGEVPNRNIGSGIKILSDKKGKKYITTAPGIITSVGNIEDGWPSLSYIFDDRGIYNNPYRASGLEELIIKTELEDDDIVRARKIISYIKEHKITKYNDSIDLKDSAFAAPAGKNVLIIDEALNSKSFTPRAEREIEFKKMFNFVSERYGEHNIILYSSFDKKNTPLKGFLSGEQRKVNVLTVSENINPYDLFDLVDAVLCVDSEIGFSALIAGKKTYCFGKAFYSNWGLTEDSKKIKRRKKDLSIEELVAYSLIKYPRYLDPYTKNLTNVENILETIVWLKEKYKRHSRYYHCVGFSNWQKNYVKGFLKRPGNDVFFYSSSNSALKDVVRSGGKLVVDSKRINDEIKYISSKKAIDVLSFDDGFIRSIGIPSAHTASSSAILDDLGIYYDAKFESRLEDLLLESSLNIAQKTRARNIIELIKKHNINKYNYKTPNLRLTFPRNKKLILVIGQDENDPKIIKTKSKIRTNLRLLEYVRAKNPGSYIIFKPHPEVVKGKAKGHIKKLQARKYANFIIEKCSLNELFHRCDEVHTISSTCGFYALINSKKTYTYGSPFYAGWGLTEDKVIFEARNKQITIEDLVYATLIQYSMYYDIRSGLPCRLEHLIQKIVNKRKMMQYNESLDNNKSLNFFEKFFLKLIS